VGPGGQPMLPGGQPMLPGEPELRREEEERPRREPPLMAPRERPVISVEALSKNYGRIRALREVTLAVRQGEVFGFLGPNGAGKSTMIRTLLGFLHPTAGRATVFGLDVVRDSVEIRSRSGYLPGGVEIYDSLSGSAALDYLSDLQGREPLRRQELCERLQMQGSVLRRRIRDYSRGMRQKLGVIQSLQHDPELAILDEPTEGLDPLMQQAFYAIIDDLRSEGRTIFFSSHILSEVERICDRVAIIRAGQLMAVQHVDELLARRKRRVELRWRGTAPDLSDVPGLADVVTSGDRVSATLLGDVSPFVRAIASPALEDLTIEPARLEEAFLEFYSDDETPVEIPASAAAPSAAGADDA
jgi:ABC-2 type transport system ATP-binding protein